jgi:hypothetical protein
MARAAPAEAVCWASTATSKVVRAGTFPEDIAGVESRVETAEPMLQGCLTEELGAV